MADTKELRLIAFRVGAETFVIDIMIVRQIIPARGATAVPNAPSFVEGIVVLRNEVVPIVDLRERFHVEERSEQALIVIIDTDTGPIGLKVDEVRRMVTVSSDALLPPPEIVRGVRGDLLIAVIPSGDEVYLLMDIDSVLTPEERLELQSAELSSPAPGTSER